VGEDEVVDPLATWSDQDEGVEDEASPVESSPDPGAGVAPAVASTSRRERWRMVLSLAVRAVATTALLLAVYYLLPFDRDLTVGWIIVLVLGLVLVAVIIAWEVREILHSDHPVIRAIEALVFAIPLFLLLFSTCYFLMGHTAHGVFNVTLTRTDALYFTVTVFATVGFGDIVPKSEVARLVVTAQMLTDLVLIGLVVHAIVGAARLGVQRRYGASRALADGGPVG
jgi:voltage-gated potassium channel